MFSLRLRKSPFSQLHCEETFIYATAGNMCPRVLRRRPKSRLCYQAKKEEINRAQGAKGAKGRNKLNSSRLCHCRFNFRLNFALHFASSQFSLEKIQSKKGRKKSREQKAMQIRKCINKTKRAYTQCEAEDDNKLSQREKRSVGKIVNMNSSP